MLKVILNRYLLFGLLLNLVLILSLNIDYIYIYIFNIFSLLIYYFVLNSQLSKPSTYYQSKNLIFNVSLYSIIFVILFNVISYFYNQNFFVFSEADAVSYHLYALDMSKDSLQAGIARYFFYGNAFDDLGAVLFITILYKIVASNLFVNLIYLFSGVLASFYMFRIGRKFMSHKYAFIAAFAYSVSSFVLWFHASGLKESILIFFVILTYDQYYEFIAKKKIINIVLLSSSLILLLLFRPAISFLILMSMFFSFFVYKRKSLGLILLIPLSSIFIFFTYSYVELLFQNFVGNDLNSLLERKESEGMIIISLPMTIATNILASLIGPIPTIIPNSLKTILSFYSIGLILKVLFSIVSWIGVYFAFKRRFFKLYPLIFFLIFEAISLSFILEGLELRKSLPHFFIFYLIAFWFLDYLNKEDSFLLVTKKKVVKLAKFSFFISFILMIIWNLRTL